MDSSLFHPFQLKRTWTGYQGRFYRGLVPETNSAVWHIRGAIHNFPGWPYREIHPAKGLLWEGDGKS